jgi:hypothetical protein
MSRILGTIGLLLVAGGGICLAQTEAPSLGDLARQQKHDKKAVIVLTDEDSTVVPASALSSGPAVPSTVAAPGNSSAGTDNTTDKTGGGSLPTSNGSSAVSELKSKLDYLKVEQDSWKRSAKRNQELLANESSDFRRQMYQDALDNDRKNVALYGRKIDEAQAELAKAQQASSAGAGTDKSSNQTSPPNGTKEP